MPISLAGYYNRFDAADNYQDLLFRAGKGLQSAELNELQATIVDRFKRVADAVFRDGAVIQGEPPVIDSGTGATSCPESVIYAAGAMRTVPAASFTIPVVGQVRIGVYLLSTEITEVEDATLRDPATGTRNYQEPGAGRLQVAAAWGHDGDGQSGDFYAVYNVTDGNLFVPSPLANPFMETLARYDREANGNYIVEGLYLKAIAAGTFSIAQGVGNVYGYKIDLPTARRFTHALDPDLESVTSEPDTFINSATDIQLNRYPVDAITEVVATVEKSVQITRGGSAGGADALPDVSVVSVVSVTQGATTYTSPADYNLVGDTIDWAPAGQEPSPGSTYDVTYRYLTNVTPTNIDLLNGTFRISGAVAGELVLTDYDWKVPRYDRLCLNRDGEIVRVKGVPSRYKAFPPKISSDLLFLGTIYQDWKGVPSVQSDGIRSLHYSELERQRNLVLDLFDLIAQERLRWDMTEREPTTKRGVFVDPFLDNDMRDAGITQTAAIVSGNLQLSISADTIYATQNNAQDWMLPYTEGAVLTQAFYTGGMKINPYGGFDPLEGQVVLDPPMDRWVDETTEVLDAPFIQNFGQTVVTRRFMSVEEFVEATGHPGNLINGWGRSQAPFNAFRRNGDAGWTDREQLIGTDERITTIREIDVDFTVTGFNPNETITEVMFDGIDVTPGGVVCNGSGVATGTFTIPANVPSGIRSVTVQGGLGSTAASAFTGETVVITRRLRRTRVRNIDPLAQTFQLEEGRWITSVDLWFTTLGDTSNPVEVQIREVEVGMPNSIALASGVIDASTITTGQWTTVALSRPIWLPSNEEYAIVVLTDDLNHAIGIGEVGKADINTGDYATRQPYLVGAMLKSSNGSTWTPQQEADLTFRLNAATFTSNTRVVDLGPVKTFDITGLTQTGGTVTATAPSHGLTDQQTVIVAGADQPEYNGAYTATVTTADSFQYVITGDPASPATGTIYGAPGDVSDLIPLAVAEMPTRNCALEFRFDAADGSTITTPPNIRAALTSVVTSGLNLSALLYGNTKESPLLYPGTQVALGRLGSSGTYVSRAVPCQANAQVVITYEAFLPSGATVTVEIEKSDQSWEAVSSTSSTALGDGVVEFTHEQADFANGGAETRCRLTLAGSPASRPFIQNLRMFVI